MRRYNSHSIPELEDKNNCIVSVMGDYTSYQCQRKRGHGKKGLLCKQHAKMQAAGKSLYIPQDV